MVGGAFVTDLAPDAFLGVQPGLVAGQVVQSKVPMRGQVLKLAEREVQLWCVSRILCSRLGLGIPSDRTPKSLTLLIESERMTEVRQF